MWLSCPQVTLVMQSQVNSPPSQCKNPRPWSTSGELLSALMHSSKSILHAACPVERCCLTAGRGHCISLAAQMMRKTIWVTNEHLNLYGSVSATSQSSGHPVLNPEYTSSHVLILDTVSTGSSFRSQALHSFQSSIYNFRRLPLTHIFFSPLYRKQT